MTNIEKDQQTNRVSLLKLIVGGEAGCVQTLEMMATFLISFPVYQKNT
jgi:hypothetical protein